MSRGYLGLGSNVGDRYGHLRAALDGARAAGVRVVAVSSPYETEPVGEILDQPDFLNAAVRIETELEPRGCSTSARRSRPSAGATFAGPRHGPRPLDVDLLLLDDVELRERAADAPASAR